MSIRGGFGAQFSIFEKMIFLEFFKYFWTFKKLINTFCFQTFLYFNCLKVLPILFRYIQVFVEPRRNSVRTLFIIAGHSSRNLFFTAGYVRKIFFLIDWLKSIRPVRFWPVFSDGNCPRLQCLQFPSYFLNFSNSLLTIFNQFWKLFHWFSNLFWTCFKLVQVFIYSFKSNFDLDTFLFKSYFKFQTLCVKHHLLQIFIFSKLSPWFLEATKWARGPNSSGFIIPGKRVLCQFQQRRVLLEYFCAPQLFGLRAQWLGNVNFICASHSQGAYYRWKWKSWRAVL